MLNDLTANDHASVTDAIKQAETQTQAEIMVVMARHCDDYLHVPLHIAALLALTLPFILTLFYAGSVPLTWFFASQLLVFILASLLFSLPALRYWATPKSLMRKYAHAQAAAQFLSLNAHATADRTGVLIFVAERERYCEIITDKAVAEKISPAQWQSIIDQMTSAFKSGKVVEGIKLAVEQSSTLLAENFPPKSKNPNELPDHFVIIS